MDDDVTTSGDAHGGVPLLLPWYVAGTLDPAERAKVDGHLTTCDACRDDLAAERRLADAVGDSPAPQAIDGWDKLAARLDEASPPLAPLSAAQAHRADRRRRTRPPLFSDPRRLRWLVGAQAAAILALAPLVTMPAARIAAYTALGDAPAPRAGNVVAMFRPDTPEAKLRGALAAAGARLVDGPTAAGAYVLDVPGGEHGRSLAVLRASPQVTMAEPIGGAATE